MDLTDLDRLILCTTSWSQDRLVATLEHLATCLVQGGESSILVQVLWAYCRHLQAFNLTSVQFNRFLLLAYVRTYWESTELSFLTDLPFTSLLVDNT